MRNNTKNQKDYGFRCFSDHSCIVIINFYIKFTIYHLYKFKDNEKVKILVTTMFLIFFSNLSQKMMLKSY